MTTRAGIARHRAEATSSLAIIAKAVSENAGGVGRQAAVIAAAGGLVLTSGVAANAAEASAQREASAPVALEAATAVQAPVSAEATAALTFERPAVESVAAPVVEPPAPAPAAQAQPAAQASATVRVASSAPVAPVAPKSGLGAAIAAAAYAQLGVAQDCTMLATNSLAAVGIHYHGWPAGYLSLGRTVSAAEAQPGDLAYYQDGGMGLAHIAVYVGNGQAVHGGWNGGTTALFSVNVGSGPVFIRVGG